jgi:hypothetical protein
VTDEDGYFGEQVAAEYDDDTSAMIAGRAAHGC